MATKKVTEKAVEPKKVKVVALFKFNYQGKAYEKGEEFELFDGSAKDLIDRNFVKKA